MAAQLSPAEAERQRAKALSRWEGEGGALGAPPRTLDDGELRILARLGAGLLWHWQELGEQTQAAIFERASKLHAEADAERIRLQIERLLAERPL
jgi:hypothetical protein